MKRVLIWDAPNMDMALSEILGRRPVGEERPRVARLMDWLQARGRADNDEVSARVFANVSDANRENEKFLAFYQILQTSGFEIFLKPKSASGEGDIDENMVAYGRELLTQGGLRELIIGSHDARCFADLATTLIGRGINVVILGYHDRMGGYCNVEGLQRVDLEEIRGMFRTPPPRPVRVEDLPLEGHLFRPLAQIVPRPQPPGGQRSGKRRQAANDVTQLSVEALLGNLTADARHTVRILKANKILVVADLAKLTRKQLMDIPGIGRRRLDLIEQKLREKALKLASPRAPKAS